MSLINCKECNKEVSNKAASCPNCGAPIKPANKKYGCGTLILLILTFCIIFFFISSNDKPDKESQISNPIKTTHDINKNIKYAHQNINIRDGAGEKYKVIAQLKRGDSVSATIINDKWVKISVGGQDKGYVFASLLNDYPIPPIEISSSNWYPDPDFTSRGAVVWHVEIRNNTNNYIEYVKVEFSTYDSNKNLITTDSTYVKGLAPGSTGSSKGYATYFGKEKTANIRIVR